MFALVSCFISLAVGLNAFATAVPCPEVNLMQSPNSPFRHIPIWDQDGSSTCYAHAAAAIANYYLLKSKKAGTAVINPVYAAWVEKYKSRLLIGNSTLNGGQAFNVMNAIKESGFCTNLDVERRLKDFKDTAYLSDSELARFLESSYKEYGKNREWTYWGPPDENWRNRVLADVYEYVPRCDFKKLTAYQDLHHLTGLSATKALKDLFGDCKVFQPAFPDIRHVDTGIDVDIANEISRDLTKDSPPAISMACFSSFETNPGRSRPLLGLNLPRDDYRNHKQCRFKKDGDHAIVIAGQKVIAGQCQYLLRNSLGTYWQGDGASACACITNRGRYKDSCRSYEAAEFLGCWYKRSDVVPSTKSVTAYE